MVRCRLEVCRAGVGTTTLEPAIYRQISQHSLRPSLPPDEWLRMSLLPVLSVCRHTWGPSPPTLPPLFGHKTLGEGKNHMVHGDCFVWLQEGKNIPQQMACVKKCAVEFSLTRQNPPCIYSQEQEDLAFAVSGCL